MSAWEGLGINTTIPYGQWYQNTAETHVAYNTPYLAKVTQFPKIRMTTDYENYLISGTSRVATRFWALDIKAYKPTQYIQYGAGGNTHNLAAYYSTYLTYMLEEAQFAQDNLMDMFSVGNELENSGQNGSISVSSLSRSSNVATVTTAVNHGLTSGDTITISGATPTSFNVSQAVCTVTGDNTFTYANTGVDESATGTIIEKCGFATLVRLIKLLVTAAQVVFTRGPVIYNLTGAIFYQQHWIDSGSLGDLDYLGCNIYAGNNFYEFKSEVDNAFAAFGDKIIITEFNFMEPWTSTVIKNTTPANKNFDPIFAQQIYQMMDYTRSIGITQVYYYTLWGVDWSAHYAPDATIGSGNFKSVVDRLMERRVRTVFLGSQAT